MRVLLCLIKSAVILSITISMVGCTGQHVNETDTLASENPPAMDAVQLGETAPANTDEVPLSNPETAPESVAVTDAPPMTNPVIASDPVAVTDEAPPSDPASASSSDSLTGTLPVTDALATANVGLPESDPSMAMGAANPVATAEITPAVTPLAVNEQKITVAKSAPKLAKKTHRKKRASAPKVAMTDESLATRTVAEEAVAQEVPVQEPVAAPVVQATPVIQPTPVAAKPQAPVATPVPRIAERTPAPTPQMQTSSTDTKQTSSTDNLKYAALAGLAAGAGYLFFRKKKSG